MTEDEASLPALCLPCSRGWGFRPDLREAGLDWLNGRRISTAAAGLARAQQAAFIRNPWMVLNQTQPGHRQPALGAATGQGQARGRGAWTVGLLTPLCVLGDLVSSKEL